MTNIVEIPADAAVVAARELARGGRWQTATELLDAAVADEPLARARLALAAAEVAVERDWFSGTDTAAERLAVAERRCAAVDVRPESRWDLTFARMRHAYACLLRVDGAFRPGPWGKDEDAIVALGRQVDELSAKAPEVLRHGWAQMYRGLVFDNVKAERDAAPACYQRALAAGERGDDLLAREALRHLGDHDHDNGDHEQAAVRWARATELGARAGNVPGTLSQQLLLAVLARDGGNEAAATALATEVARWAAALGSRSLESQATAFLAGVDPTAAPAEAATQ